MMPVLPRSTRPLRTLAALSAVLALALPVHTGLAVDTTVTGSVGSAAATQLPEGSGAFRRALSLLDAKKWADAYQAGRGLSDDDERRAVQWAAIFYGEGAVDYRSVARFAADAPDYATSGLYKTRLEQALISANPSGDEVIHLLGGEMPNVIGAQIALASAYAASGQSARAARIAKSIWTQNYLTREEEDRTRARLGGLLTREDHWQRAVMLLMHDRASGAERLLDQLSPAQRSLAHARIAVSRKAKNSEALLDKVDPAYRKHPLFYFSRAQRARDLGAYEQAVEFLNAATGALPEHAEWWYERRTLSRMLLARGNPKAAYRAAAGYPDDGPEGRVVDANFHAGYIALNYLGDPRVAAEHFRLMRSESTLADTVSQSEYWWARALKTAGDSAGARAHFEAAARFGTQYYGLLAREELGQPGVTLRGMPAWQDAADRFERRGIVRSIRLLARNGHATLAQPLARQLGRTLTDAGELVLAARLAQDIDAHHEAILIADIANGRGVALDLFSYPKDGLPAHYKLADVDKAAVYAIARQESRFDRRAISRSGARGLMQLMPATAKETAQKVGLGYSADKLTEDPAYNALLGSTYLAAQLARYDGSLVLAAAAYNAGGGNVNKWLETFGDPRTGKVDPVVWIEAIPFVETRKYVQRVMGNYLVYRARMGDNGMTMSRALRTIPR